MSIHELGYNWATRVPYRSYAVVIYNAGETKRILAQPDHKLTGNLGAFATGTRSYPGGKGLGGEEGEELYITPDGKAGIIGSDGPQLFSAPAGTVIYPADATKRVLEGGSQQLVGNLFSAAAGAGVNASLFGADVFGPGLDLPGPIQIPQGPDSEVTTDNTTDETKSGVDLTLFSKFLQNMGQGDVGGLAQRASQLAQEAGGKALDAAKGTVEQIKDIFSSGLFGGRRDAPQTQVINIAINNSQDYSTSNYHYNYGGLQMKTARSTESLARDFRLLQAVAG